MQEYQPFSISNFRIGFDESVEPWLLPKDAYQAVVNAHLYRGVLEKINGYDLYANMTYRYTQSLGTPDGMTSTFMITLSHTPVATTMLYAYGTIVLGTTAETFHYSTDGISPIVNLLGNAGGSGTVNTSTGAVSITFGTPPPSGTYSTIFITYDALPSPTTAIMGIKQYYRSDGTQDVIVFDTKRVGKVIPITGLIAEAQDANYAVSEIQHDYYQSKVVTLANATLVYTSGVAGVVALVGGIVPGSVVFTEYTSTGAATGNTIVDNGLGNLMGTGITTASSHINYLTGAYVITYAAGPVTGHYLDVTSGVFGTLFTGGISNFFSVTNYQYNMFFTNNVDPIQYYDGSAIHYLDTNVTVPVIIPSTGGVPQYYIRTCLHVFTNRDRLLLILPNVNGTLAVSTIYWSAVFDPFDFVNGDLLQAPTSEPIRAIGYINSDLVVRFANSERVFRYTADPFAPFRWDSTNSVWACDAPYSPINYNTWFSSVGRPAIVASDGVNAQRADERIPDFTDPSIIAQQLPIPYMNQTSIIQCYGERFDDIKEGWLCYNSLPIDEGVTVTASDNVLAFNYLDETYAVYSFPFSCLGFGRVITAPTWGTIFKEWGQMEETWGTYDLTTNALLDLAGDQFDKVYELNEGSTQTVAGDDTTTPVPVLMSVFTKNFNPYIDQGQLCRFGYVDLLVSAYGQTKMRVQFYLNDELTFDSNGIPIGFYQETTLTFATQDAMSPTQMQTKVWKRVYVGAVGKTHTIRFYQNELDFDDPAQSQPIYIHGMILYMKPAGRIFN